MLNVEKEILLEGLLFSHVEAPYVEGVSALSLFLPRQKCWEWGHTSLVKCF